MSYSLEMTIPITATTTPNYVTSGADVARGILTNLYLRFQDSINGTAMIKIYLDSTQIFPRTVGSYARLVRSPIQVHDLEPMTVETGRLMVWAAAEKAVHAHRATISWDVFSYDVPELIL